MTEFKIGRHCMGSAREHFEKKFKGAGTGALELAFVEIGMEGFHIGFDGKVDLYNALHKLSYACARLDEHPDKTINMALYEEAKDIAIDALAKARGETE